MGDVLHKLGLHIKIGLGREEHSAKQSRRKDVGEGAEEGPGELDEVSRPEVDAVGVGEVAAEVGQSDREHGIHEEHCGHEDQRADLTGTETFQPLSKWFPLGAEVGD